MWKSAVQRFINAAGFQLSRKTSAVRTGFYPVSPSCQIPTLSTLYEALLGRKTDGYFVEVGTFDGESFSNVSCLSDLGWSGLLVEPVPEFADRAERRHAANHRVRLVRAAIGSAEGELELSVAGALSTADPEMVATYRKIDWARDHLRHTRSVRVPMLTLDRLLDDYDAPSGFEVLSIDTEGFESQVMAGFSLARWRPLILIIELVDFHPDLIDRRAVDQRIAADIAAEGYTIVYKDSINTMFARNDRLVTLQ